MKNTNYYTKNKKIWHLIFIIALLFFAGLSLLSLAQNEAQGKVKSQPQVSEQMSYEELMQVLLDEEFIQRSEMTRLSFQKENLLERLRENQSNINTTQENLRKLEESKNKLMQEGVVDWLNQSSQQKQSLENGESQDTIQ